MQIMKRRPSLPTMGRTTRFFWAGLLAAAISACQGTKSEGTTPRPSRIETAGLRPESRPSNQAGSRTAQTSPAQSQSAARLGPQARRGGQASRPVSTSPGNRARPAGPGQAPRSAVVTTTIMTKAFPGHKVTGLALGQSGLALATDDKRVHLLDPTSGKELWLSDPVDQSLSHLSFAAASPMLAAVGDQLSSYIWNLDEKKLFRTWHRKAGRRQALSADGSMLVREDRRHSVRWFQLATYKMKWLVKARLLGLSLDGTKALCLTKQGNLELRGAHRGRLVRKVRGWKTVTMAAANQDASKVVVISVSGQGQARTWDLELRCTRTSGKASPTKTRLASTPLDLVVLWPVRLALVRTAKGLLFWDLCRKRIVENRPMPLVAMAAFGDRIAVAQPDGTVHIWRVSRTLPTCPVACAAEAPAAR